MKKAGFQVTLVAVPLAAVMILGCGGGGSSSRYSGLETAAQIESGPAAADWLTGGYGVLDALSVPVGTVVGPAWPAAPAALPAESMVVRIDTTEYTRTVDGASGGSFTLDWLVNTFTGAFEGTISYDGYSVLPGDSVSGIADAGGTGFNEDAPPGEIQLTFAGLSLDKWGAPWQAFGGLSAENFSAVQQGGVSPLAFLADSVVTIDSLVLEDPDGVTMKLTDARIQLDFQGSLYSYTLEGAAPGSEGARLYHPDFGYLYLSTVDPVEIDNGSGLPLYGVIQIADEAGGYAWLWLSYQGTVYWEVWLDGGNGVLDYGTGDGADDTQIVFGSFSEGVFTVIPPG